MVDRATVKHACELYISSAHPVFNLVPPGFGAYLENCYKQMLCPSVDHHTVWTVYLNLLAEIWWHAEALCILESLAPHVTTLNDHGDDELPLLIGLKDLHFNESNENYYMGGVRGGLGLGKLLHFAWSNDQWHDLLYRRRTCTCVRYHGGGWTSCWW